MSVYHRTSKIGSFCKTRHKCVSRKDSGPSCCEGGGSWLTASSCSFFRIHVSVWAHGLLLSTALGRWLGKGAVQEPGRFCPMGGVLKPASFVPSSPMGWRDSCQICIIIKVDVSSCPNVPHPLICPRCHFPVTLYPPTSVSASASQKCEI